MVFIKHNLKLDCLEPSTDIFNEDFTLHISFLHQVIEACVQNCGQRFHSEIGKYRFINELIKLISSKVWFFSFAGVKYGMSVAEIIITKLTSTVQVKLKYTNVILVGICHSQEAMKLHLGHSIFFGFTSNAGMAVPSAVCVVVQDCK